MVALGEANIFRISWTLSDEGYGNIGPLSARRSVPNDSHLEGPMPLRAALCEFVPVCTQRNEVLAQ